MSIKLGIAHVLPEGAPVIHCTLMGKNALGRVTDVVAAWCRQEMKLEANALGDLRVLTQALMEFSSQLEGQSLGQIEVGYSQHLILLSTRFEFRRDVNLETLQKEITQFWLNSEDVKIFKKVLYPHDRVEVRYQSKLNLIEWRVYRSTRAGEVVDNNPSFAVFCDDSLAIDAGLAKYTDMGDLPFQNWLSDVYQNRPQASRTGEVVLAGDSSQDEEEWARIVVEREQSEIDQMISVSSSSLESDSSSFKVTGSAESSQDSTLVSSYSEEIIKELLAEQVDLKDSVKNCVLEMKQRELRTQREFATMQKRLQQMELLLRRKELVNQRNQSERKVLQEKLEAERKKKSVKSDKSDSFREKAMEMFEMLKRVKEENAALEKMMIEVRQKEREQSERPVERPAEGYAVKPTDDMFKKLDRITRALDTEKSKVKSLSERVIAAEKEAQGTGPLIADLESKVEHTLKTVQQHKKETEVVKQKLVQAEAEKNKIKNELAKAHAQIQTLMKRQAA